MWISDPDYGQKFDLFKKAPYTLTRADFLGYEGYILWLVLC